MSNRKLRRRFLLIFIWFCFSVLAVLFAYYFIFSSYVRQNTRESMAVTEDRLLSELSHEFMRLRVAAESIAANTFVQNFLTESNVSAYYEKAGTVSEIINRTIFPHMSGDHISTITAGGVSYLFTGGISSAGIRTVYERILKTYAGATLYFVVELDGTDYFCLISPVFADGFSTPQPVGYVVALSYLARARRHLTDPDALMGIDTAIIADDVVLLSSNYELEGQSASEMERLYGSVILERFADSNLFASVMITNNALFFGERLLFIITLVVFAVLTVAFASLHRVLSAKMVSPMLERADDMRMGLLRTQIDAHFTINTIACIAGLARQGKNEKIIIAAENLSKMLTNRHSSNDEVNVYDQMEDIERYIEIMNVRSDDKFEVELDVDEALMNYRMHGRVLQPLVENAMTHGVGSKTGDCLLDVTGRLEDGNIIFQISDNGAGIMPAQLQALQEMLDSADEWDYDDYRLKGVAMVNIQKRIRAQYGKQYGLTLAGNPKGGLTVTVSLPAIRDDRELIT